MIDVHGPRKVRGRSARSARAAASNVQNLRIEDAKHLFESSDRSVDEISFDVGYEDPSFFRRLFRRRTGLAPARYRRAFSRFSAPWPSIHTGGQSVRRSQKWRSLVSVSPRNWRASRVTRHWHREAPAVFPSFVPSRYTLWQFAQVSLS